MKHKRNKAVHIWV